MKFIKALNAIKADGERHSAGEVLEVGVDIELDIAKELVSKGACEEAVKPTADEVALSDMSKAELIEYANSIDLEIDEKLTKAKMIEFIEANE